MYTWLTESILSQKEAFFSAKIALYGKLNLVARCVLFISAVRVSSYILSGATKSV